MSKLVSDTLDSLGYRGKDRVTGFAGVISSACFDLYGCVQFALTPPANDKGEAPDGRWYDVARVVIDRNERVMAPPCRFVDDHGPVEHARPAY